jgi:hypothetical protein
MEIPLILFGQNEMGMRNGTGGVGYDLEIMRKDPIAPDARNHRND